jgi:DNA modification methylase
VLAERAIRNSSTRGDLVLDLFLGSGTTLIAAEALGRCCYGLELEPRYCDVIVRRFEQFTGKKAERLAAQVVEPRDAMNDPAPGGVARAGAVGQGG